MIFVNYFEISIQLSQNFVKINSKFLICFSEILYFQKSNSYSLYLHALWLWIKIHFAHYLRNILLSWLNTYRFSHFDMFVHYFVRLRTNHYTLLTISPISFIFDSVRNLMRNFPYLLFDVSWKYWLPGENGETRDEKNDWRDGLQNAIYTLIVSLILPTFFRVLVNLTISV